MTSKYPCRSPHLSPLT